MPIKPLHIVLADDDSNDTFLFQEALGQIPVETRLDVTGNGMELMDALKNSETVPDLIFLDMNMPVKNELGSGRLCFGHLQENYGKPQRLYSSRF